VKTTKTQRSKKEEKEDKESKNPDTTGNMTKEIPGERERVIEERKIMARFKCGNRERENRY
jgi:hypothetical protein